MPAKPRPVIERAFEKVLIPDDPNDCWIWIAGCDSNGYGKIGLGPDEGRRTVKAHYVFYRHFMGEPPKGLEPDHLCRNIKCVNYQHLEYVTHLENMRRGRAPSMIQSKKDTCKNGHKRTEKNTYINADGSRSCQDCNTYAGSKRSKHCIRNHEWTSKNTIYDAGGHRVCVTCKENRPPIKLGPRRTRKRCKADLHDWIPENLIMTGGYYRCKPCHYVLQKTYRANKNHIEVI